MTTRYNLIQNEFERQIADREDTYAELSKVAWQSVVALMDFLGITSRDIKVTGRNNQSYDKIAFGRDVEGEFVPCYAREINMVPGRVEFAVALVNVCEDHLNQIHINVDLSKEGSDYVFRLMNFDEGAVVRSAESDSDFSPFCDMVFEKYRNFYAKRP